MGDKMTVEQALAVVHMGYKFAPQTEATSRIAELEEANRQLSDTVS